MIRLIFSFFLVMTCLSIFSPNAHPEETSRVYGKPTFHQVEKGDYLYKIALQYNCSYPAVGRANGIRNANEVRIGMKLTIPSFMILPGRENDETVVINLPELRLYHFRSDKEVKVNPSVLG